MKKILKMGHRGAKGYEPENTLISFQKAIDLGAAGIEVDVHLSHDGAIIVIHDETINRTTNGKGFVNKFSLQELKMKRAVELREKKVVSQQEYDEIQAALEALGHPDDHVLQQAPGHAV